MHRTLRTLALAGLAGLAASAAQAQTFVNGAPATIGGVTQFVWNGQNISASNPVPVAVVSGGGGSGGAAGSVGAAGANGTTAQSVQGIVGGVPQNTYAGQFNTTLPTLASGATGYLAVDSSGRLIQSPGASVTVSSGTVTVTGVATAANQNATAAGTSATSAQAVQGVTGGVPQAVSLPAAATTTTGVLEPPTAAAGKITRTSTALAASTSTTIAAANANRISFGIQCATGGVSVDETGAALTAAGVGNGTLFIPAGTAPYFTPPIATRTAVTAYTATAQTCVVTEYLR